MLHGEADYRSIDKSSSSSDTGAEDCRPVPTATKAVATGYPMLHLGRLCERLRQYHKVSALQKGSGCGRSGRCDGHSLPTGFAEITFASKHLGACLSAGVFVISLFTALQDRRLDFGCV